MSLNASLARIVSDLPVERLTPYSGNPLADFIRSTAARDVQAAAGVPEFILKGSAGAGQWATVPWIALFDPVVTDSATREYYIVYLFHAAERIVHLSLNQGATKTREEYGGQTRDVLRERATLMRRRLSDFASKLPVHSIELGSTAQLPADYEAGHALGLSYTPADLASENKIAEDLKTIINAYKALTFRGGLDPTSEDGDDVIAPSASLVEQRRYKMHRRIERNPRAAKEAKRHHGVTCQACDLTFTDRYGALGDGFIEAHHLRPIGSLEEGVAVSYDIAADFAVLCSNCHRMIHRTDDPSDLPGFRLLVRS